MRKKAFTLIELLVVIAIIAILMAILMPALRLAKDQAYGVICVSNLRNLTRAWYLYQDDNDSKLVNGHTPSGNFTKGIHGIEPPQDVAGNPTTPGGNPTREDEWRGIERGLLFPYAKDLDVYRCPADRRRRGGPGREALWRSYSIAGGMNGEDGDQSVKKYTDIKNPANWYVFAEECDAREWNRGSWIMKITGNSWTDPLAVWHNKRSCLGWADTRADKHRWVDKSTMEIAARAADGVSISKVVPAGEGKDLKFMQDHYIQKDR